MRTALSAAFLAIVLALPGALGFSQVEPEYDFVDFDAEYSTLISAARSAGYQVTEEENLTPYGAYHVALDRTGQFYNERISLFFDQERRLIFYSVQFTVRDNQSRTIIGKLIDSMRDKLVEKYGESEQDVVPYYRMHENMYEILVYPPSPTSEIARVSYKHLDRYDIYTEYYQQEVEKLIDQEIERIVENL